MFAAYSDAAAAGSGDKADVILTFSTDGGATWPAANQRRINDDATLNDQFAPALAIEPGGTKLFVGWYDRRRDPLNNNIDTFGAIGAIDNTAIPPTFTPGVNFRISSESFPPVVDVDDAVPADFMGDHDTAQADESFFYYSWGDNRPSSAAQRTCVLPAYPTSAPRPARIGWCGRGGGNGNGVVERNECNQLFIGLVNAGTAPSTGLSAVLSSLTPAVSIDQPNSTYRNLNPGRSGTNMTPFAFTTSPGFVCGTTIELLLTVTTSEAGTFALIIKLPTGSLNSNAFDDVPTSTTITDNATTEFPLTVAGVSGAIGKLRVALHILHDSVDQLAISLVSPDGTTIDLSSNNDSSGIGFGLDCAHRAIFDDNAGVSVALGTIPTIGPMRPEQALAAFNGKSGAEVNGVWKLRITDNALEQRAPWNAGTHHLLLGTGGDLTPTPNDPAGVAIMDDTTMDVPLDVSGLTEAIGKVTVTITKLLHHRDQDLDISLIGPDGTSVLLTSDNGGTGPNYVGTTFDDSAVNFITAGTAPFSGKFRPEQPLAAFVGKSASAVNGTWKLRIRDEFGQQHRRHSVQLVAGHLYA